MPIVRAVTMVVCPDCFRLRRYKEWIESKITIQRMIEIAMENGIRRFHIICEQCPQCKN
jgi:hypothetical protein